MRARFKLAGQGVVGGLFERDGTNHFAAALVGRHLVQQRALAVQHADTGGAERLVAGERVEVAIEASYIDTHVGCGLGAVQQDQGPHVVSGRDDCLHGIDRSQGVGDMNHRDYSGPVAQQSVKRLHVQLTVTVDGNNHQARARLFADHLPGNDVGVVLHPGDQHFVTRSEPYLAQACGNEIDRLGGSPGKDDFVGPRRIDVIAHLVPGALVGVRGTLAQLVHAPVYVGVVAPFVGNHGIDHGLGPLRRGGAVQVGQRLAVHLLKQRREVGTACGDPGGTPWSRDVADSAHNNPPQCS